MSKSEVRVDVSEIVKRVNNLRDDFDRGATAVINKIANDGQSYMRTNAPWTDRTGNARNGLFAKPVTGGASSFKFKNEYAVVFYHSVPYGIWLEVRWSGKYAIIVPTVKIYEKKTMDLLTKIMSGGA